MKKLVITTIITIFFVSLFCIGVSADASNPFTLSAKSATGQPSKEVQVDISIDQNPGVWGFMFDISIDNRYLAIKEIVPGDLSKNNYTFQSNYVGKTGKYTEVYTIYQEGLQLNNYTETGKLMTVVFAVNADAPGGLTTPVSVTAHSEPGTWVLDSSAEAVPAAFNSGSVTIKSEATIVENDVEYYTVNGEKTNITDIVNLDDGRIVYVEEGKVNKTYTGVAKIADGNWLYFKNGVFTPATGVAQRADKSNTKWYFVLNGVYTKNSGLAKRADGSNNTWYYVKNGTYLSTAKGVAQRADKSNTTWYYLQGGKHVKNTGVAQRADGSNKTWYFVLNGVYTKNSGLAQRADKSNTTWYYVKNGAYLSTAKGVAQRADKSNTAWYYVQAGKYTKNTGIAQRADKSNTTWYYVKNGVYTKATGLAKKADGSSTTWYYVKNGAFTKSTLIVKYNKVNRYVKAGVWQSGFSGKVKIGTKTYTIKKGNVV